MEGFYEPINYISQEAKENIQKIEIEKKNSEKRPPKCKIYDLVAIQKTYLGRGLILRVNFFSPN